MLIRLLQIRLSYIYPTLFVIFFLLLSIVPTSHLTAGQLTLYTVNTFLFGFYFAPMLSSQKSRVDSLNITVRQEAMTSLDILAQSHLLKPTVRHQLKIKLKAYLDSIVGNNKVQADNQFYDELLAFTKQPEYKVDSVMDTIYGQVSKTQDDRDNLQSLLAAKLFSHEWIVIFVLFGITLYFVMQTNYGGLLLFRFILALLCTGLTLMMIILAKYSTLTHKQAKQMWVPLRQLEKTHFEDVSADEVAAEVQRVKALPVD